MLALLAAKISHIWTSLLLNTRIAQNISKERSGFGFFLDIFSGETNHIKSIKINNQIYLQAPQEV